MVSASSSAYLFVYGTLRRDSPAPMAQWLWDNARWVSTGQARGRLYRLDGYPGFVPHHNGAWVQGDFFHLPESADILSRLDHYEECSPRFPSPQEYRRMILPVIAQGVSYGAWTYVYNWPVKGRTLIASGDFLQ